VICEVSQPPIRLIRWLHYNVVLRLLPRITRPFSSNKDAYSYLAESMRDWHDQHALALLISEAGWEDVEWLNLTLGVVALHRAVKPTE
jgi:demethylmenaquinone methyltransferase/2-methoxy-6-polyprenyl-1,4-benzoquinol methylase